MYHTIGINNLLQLEIVAADQTRAIAEQMSAPTAAASAGGMPPDQKKAFKVSHLFIGYWVFCTRLDYSSWLL